MLPHDVSIEDLEAALLAGANGALGAEAAARLLIAHGAWLARDDFRRHVFTLDAEPGSAWVDFPGALDDDLLATASDHRILHLAAELAGCDSDLALGDLLDDLDEREKFLALDAIAHALGLVAVESLA